MINEKVNDKKLRYWILAGSSAILFKAVVLPFLLPAFRKICIPYLPATERQIQNLKTLIGKSFKENGVRIQGPILDLGSGDGRVVFELAYKLGLNPCYGVELNPWLIAYSRIKAAIFYISYITSNKKTNYKLPVHFECKDMWKIDFTLYNTLIVFGVSEMMPTLVSKLNHQSNLAYSQIYQKFNYYNALNKHGIFIITARFPLFPTMQHSFESTCDITFNDIKLISHISDGPNSVWLYFKPILYPQNLLTSSK